MKGRVLTDHIDDWDARAARVVQVRGPIGQPRSEVQKSESRFARDSRVAIGGCRYDTFEQTQDGANLWLTIECRDQMHFGSSGIGKTHFYAATNQSFDETLRSVHESVSLNYDRLPD